MDHNFKVLILKLVVLSLGSSTLGQSQTRVPPPCEFPAIYNFGDSNSDTGGISAAFWPMPEPYGANFFGRPAGRQSDGRIIIDFIAEHLGLPYLSPYLDSVGSNFSHGANFATGGSTIRRPNETIFENGISPFSLDIQVIQYNQFKMRSYDLYRQAGTTLNRDRLPKPNEFSQALYTFDVGQHDLDIGFRELTVSQLRNTIPGIVNQLAVAVTNLYQLGARSFWIHNAGPIGCLPATIMNVMNPSPGSLDRYGCLNGHNAMAREFNRQLQARIRRLRTELPRAAVTYVDMYTAQYHLISNAESYGFTNPMGICCGLHQNNVHVGCGRRTVINGSEVFGSACSAPGSYISWDGVHFTQAANHWIANHIFNGSFSDPPIPITRACLKR